MSLVDPLVHRLSQSGSGSNVNRDHRAVSEREQRIKLLCDAR
jgi:hypothetical protein